VIDVRGCLVSLWHDVLFALRVLGGEMESWWNSSHAGLLRTVAFDRR